MSGLWLRVVEPMSCRDRSGVIHATKEWPKPRRTTIDTLCGRRAKYLAGGAVDTSGKKLGLVVLDWPPRLALLDDDERRCARCYELTGKPRPGSSWPKDGDKAAYTVAERTS